NCKILYNINYNSGVKKIRSSEIISFLGYKLIDFIDMCDFIFRICFFGLLFASCIQPSLNKVFK
ncbi:hypothetical protein, partial [Elizabethkingia argenteiflava]|uniref:hypothetical protein n=1 Tax=Elizabethkingia argenteiflava TaxID=2681556 RepID=UPI001BB35DBB